MTKEQAARILDPKTREDALAEIEYYGGFRGEEAVKAAMNEACRIAAAELRNKPTGEALTMEQLRGMDGQPVWVDFTGSNFERPAGWFILRSIENGEAYLVGKTSVYKALEYYGKVWRAYTYPPAHIDREAWTAEWIYPENEFNLPRCSKCGCNSKDAQYSHKDNFCPKCGRAMTQEGRAIMEKRLMG